ncbi:MAG: phospho-sugar mutase [Candidatus Nanosyncoccaceae bacterium]|jgi:phosphoglucomutase/phosphomannomutase
MFKKYRELVETKLSPEAIKNLQIWLEDKKYQVFWSEIERLILSKDWAELEDSFFKVLEFGTAGRRGKTGVGPNRINKITIGESAQGLCQYLLKTNKAAQSQGVAIAYDTRLTSRGLAIFAAQVVAGNGFKAYLFNSFRATPELSFAVRHLKAAAGIVISASHNPPADNGFKAYSSYGGQLVAPHDKGVLEESVKVKDIKTIDFDKALADDQIEIIGEAVDQAYMAELAKLSLSTARNIEIVYSPLHGAGQTSVLPLLERVGFNQVDVVKAQMTPDGNFPNVPNHKPNPEEPAANDMAIEQMIKTKADIAITTDPDADRLAVIVNHHGEAVRLNGNQSLALVFDYILQKQQAKNGFIVKTIVTTDLLASLADCYKVKCYGDLLVGFKFIGALIEEKQPKGEKFIAGGEESYGMLYGDHARDKDAASGVLPLAEYAAELKESGKTLYDRLLEIYMEQGFYYETQATAEFPGAAGFANMQKLMANLRTKPFTLIGKRKVTAIRDYQDLIRTDLVTGKTSKVKSTGKSNVIVLEFGDYACRATIRPSGTEPKIKVYVQWFVPATASKLAEEQLKSITKLAEQIAQQIKAKLV